MFIYGNTAKYGEEQVFMSVIYKAVVSVHSVGSKFKLVGSLNHGNVFFCFYTFKV